MITRINSNNHMYHFWFRNISISKLWKDDYSFSGFTIFSEHHRGQICSGWCWAYNDS